MYKKRREDVLIKGIKMRTM